MKSNNHGIKLSTVEVNKNENKINSKGSSSQKPLTGSKICMYLKDKTYRH